MVPFRKDEVSVRDVLRIGTRGSRLALVQTELVLEALKRAHPDVPFQVVVIRSTGDRHKRVALARLGGRGTFVVELEVALREGRIDMAVHSLKDLPTRLPPGLCLASVPLRDDPRDALVTRHANGLAGLPEGAVVGTSSLRRAYQLLALRPDLKIVPIRGNVDSRVRKVRDGSYDGVVVAAAALHRLGIQADYIFSPEEMLPAAGQGAVAIEVRNDDAEALALAESIDDATVRVCVEAERAFEEGLGIGCHGAGGAFATICEGKLVLQGLLAVAPGQLIKGKIEGHPQDGRWLGHRLAHMLSAKSALATQEER